MWDYLSEGTNAEDNYGLKSDIKMKLTLNSSDRNIFNPYGDKTSESSTWNSNGNSCVNGNHCFGEINTYKTDNSFGINTEKVRQNIFFCRKTNKKRFRPYTTYKNNVYMGKHDNKGYKGQIIGDIRYNELHDVKNQVQIRKQNRV